VAFAPAPLDLPRRRVLDWISTSADTVARYYGRFPVKRAQLLVIPIDGAGIRSGTTYAYRGAAIKLRMGKGTAEEHLVRDWVLVHEMIHLAFPSVDEQHHWIEDRRVRLGLAGLGRRLRVAANGSDVHYNKDAPL